LLDYLSQSLKEKFVENKKKKEKQCRESSWGSSQEWE
jgi:hypothetical protein